MSLLSDEYPWIFNSMAKTLNSRKSIEAKRSSGRVCQLLLLTGSWFSELNRSIPIANSASHSGIRTTITAINPYILTNPFGMGFNALRVFLLNGFSKILDDKNI